MLLWVSSWACASCCSDPATTATLRGQWWRTSHVFERGPHLVAVVGLWTLVLSSLCALSGVLFLAFALAMQDHAAWPDARVWAPLAALPLMGALALLCCLGIEVGALAAWRRWCLRNGLQPLPLAVTDMRGLTALDADDDANDNDF